MNLLDRFLNKITMYRLVLYVLFAYIVIAWILSFFGLMPFSWLELLLTFATLTLFAWLSNLVFAKIFGVAPNTESFYITAFILTLIVTHTTDRAGLGFLALVAVIAMASKYILAINRRHIFNPAAFAAVAAFYIFGYGASWWVGNMYMQIPLVIGGILIVRKIRRASMVLTFLATNLLLIALFNCQNGTGVWLAISSTFVYSYLIFFATVMFTEPSTTPPTHRLRILYGVVVGVLASPYMTFGDFYLTPELALVAGNVFSYLVSPKFRLVLKLQGKKQIGQNIYEFVFQPSRRINFQPGQYLEWTLNHKNADLRGNRRYFTIASAPSENEIRLGVKFHPQSSTFKKALLESGEGAQFFAGQLAGDFTLPKGKNEKLVFIAGGIGITPFRSMVRHLIDTQDSRDIVLLYSNKIESEIGFCDVFEQGKDVGVRTIYTLTGESPADWTGERGRIDSEMIRKLVPDFAQRIFYVSGTDAMVRGMEQTLRAMGLPRNKIKTDFFPGY